MNGIRTIIVSISFIAYVLLSNARMCQSKHSYNADYNTGIENSPAELIKNLINKDIVSNVTGAGARLSNYLMLLYNALEDSGQRQHANRNNYPRIRGFRGLKGGENKFTFQLANVWNSRVKRVEIVINLDRKRNEFHTGDMGTLVVQDSYFSTVEYVPQQYSSYVIYDVSNLKETMPSNVTIDKYLYINDDRVRISRRNEPLFLVYENLDYNPLLNEENIVQRQKRHVESIFDESVFDFNYGGNGRTACMRNDWNMNVSIIPGLNWWLFPRLYNAGYCVGHCSYPLTKEATNSTSYSFMKSVWHAQAFFLDEEVPRACCVPVEYEPLQIIHLTNNLEQDIMMIDNMIVRSCGCR